MRPFINVTFLLFVSIVSASESFYRDDEDGLNIEDFTYDATGDNSLRADGSITEQVAFPFEPTSGPSQADFSQNLQQASPGSSQTAETEYFSNDVLQRGNTGLKTAVAMLRRVMKCNMFCQQGWGEVSDLSCLLYEAMKVLQGTALHYITNGWPLEYIAAHMIPGYVDNLQFLSKMKEGPSDDSFDGYLDMLELKEILAMGESRILNADMDAENERRFAQSIRRDVMKKCGFGRVSDDLALVTKLTFLIASMTRASPLLLKPAKESGYVLNYDQITDCLSVEVYGNTTKLAVITEEPELLSSESTTTTSSSSSTSTIVTRSRAKKRTRGNNQ